MEDRHLACLFFFCPYRTNFIGPLTQGVVRVPANLPLGYNPNGVQPFYFRETTISLTEAQSFFCGGETILSHLVRHTFSKKGKNTR